MKNLTPKQNEILGVALELFRIKGFADTSMRDIAEQMNVKAASLYAHLTSKEEILEWISSDVQKRFMERFDEIISSVHSPEEKFTLVLQNHISSIFENVKLYEVFFTNIFRLRVDFKNQNKYLEIIENYIRDLEITISEYFKSLGVTDEEKLFLSTKFTVNVINNLHRYVSKENFDLDKHTNFLKNIILYGVVCKK